MLEAQACSGAQATGRRGRGDLTAQQGVDSRREGNSIQVVSSRFHKISN
jgi:hypothetical protein